MSGVLVPALAVGLLIAALAGVVSPVLAVAAVGVAAAPSAVRLLRLGLALHRAQHAFRACRGAGFVGLGVLITGLTCLILPPLPPIGRAVAAAAGLGVAVAFFIAGLLLLPGTAPTLATRMRRSFDGLSVGVSLSFAGWLLLPPEGGIHPAGFIAALVASYGLPIVALAALRAVHFRHAAMLCGAGATLSIVGLTVVAIMLSYDRTDAALAAAAVPLLAGPYLAVAGARRTGAESAPDAIDVEETFAGYPMLTLPAGAAALTALYHLITKGQFDRTAVVLGVAVALAMATRETLAAVDVRRYARRLATQEAHFRSLVAGSSDVTVVVDERLEVRWQSPAAARQFGLSDQDVLGRRMTDLIHPEDAGTVAQRLREVLAGDPSAPGRPLLVEARLRDGFGRWRDTESTVSDLRATPAVGALVVHVRDVGERKRLERTLHRLAFTDQLTALPNRRELLRTVAALRDVPGRTGAVLVVDLSGVMGINDARGREVGDAVLIEVAARLRASVGPDDVVGRLGGDEFAVVTPEGAIEAYGLGMRLLTTVTEPVDLPGATVRLNASVGMAEVNTRDSVDEILYRADLACRRAQQFGGGRVEWYDESLESLLLRRSTVEQSLPGAAGRGELDLVYQPIVDLFDRRPVGLEALLRWRHPTLGTVLPAEVIPVAEHLGVAGEIGEWVVGAAVRQLGSWLREGRDLWVSVNVSAPQLAVSGFVAGVAAALNAHRVPAERLTVEIAESGVGADLTTVVSQLAGLRALGVRTALDHFGAGQTSLAYLRRLPVDILKIDSLLFVEPGGRGGPSGPLAPLMDVVVGLGRRLGMEIVAEGLEAEGHFEAVRHSGCRYGQGYLFGRPAPAEHVEAYLETYRTPSS